ncbi:hypothetical protein, partial [Nonomuraea sp. SYSU D8015]|uniref:hypothetical protein n=1 Tax=Nonomuraea sp. SYSU D8015 TaxID=2593644 RepID=UPI001CB74BAF
AFSMSLVLAVTLAILSLFRSPSTFCVVTSSHDDEPRRAAQREPGTPENRHGGTGEPRQDGPAQGQNRQLSGVVKRTSWSAA